MPQLIYDILNLTSTPLIIGALTIPLNLHLSPYEMFIGR